jgi:hypothetical protein
VEVHPGTQIVDLIVACVTSGFVAPGKTANNSPPSTLPLAEAVYLIEIATGRSHE